MSEYLRVRSDSPDLDVIRIFTLLHGLLVIAATGGFLFGSSATSRAGSLIVVGVAVASQALIYLLPEGFIRDKRRQRVIVLLGAAVTTGWLFPLALGSGSLVRTLIALIMFAPLAFQRIPVWIVSTSVAIALVFLAPTPGWFGTEVILWETEFFVIELSLLAWVAFALLFDSLRSLKRLREDAANAETERAALADVALSLLAAADINDVFHGVSRALKDGFQIERCMMARLDPLSKVGSLVAMSDGWDPVDAGIDLGETGPLRAALESDDVLHLHDTGEDSSEDVVLITANSGVGMTLVIYCEAARSVLTPGGIALLEDVAEVTAHAMRNVQLLGATQQKAQTDPLTGLPNRRSFQSNLHREFERARRHERPLSLLMIDLDFLKSINDKYGHPAGDSVIRTAAERIVEASRGSDYLAARYGGEEFAVILPETDLEGASAAAERICEAIAETELPTVGRFTASVGAACFPVNAMTQADLVETADAALYEAKRMGRNQVAASMTHTLV
jgi:diguanylate cyclase (GGDEF)-like protein